MCTRGVLTEMMSADCDRPKCRHGGKRANAGAKKKPDALRDGHALLVRVNTEQHNFLLALSQMANVSMQEALRSFLVGCMEGDLPLPPLLVTPKP